MGSCEAVFVRGDKGRETGVNSLFDFTVMPSPSRPLSGYATDPLKSIRTDKLARELRDLLRRKLPEYMVPSTFTFLDAFPLTSNGKVDRGALPEPKADAYLHQIYEAPQSDTETRIAALWEEVLRVDRVGRHDGFFDLGGHSLLATQLVSRIRAVLGVDVPLRSLFEKPTVAKFAELVEAIRWAAKKSSASAPGDEHVEIEL